MAPVNPSSKPSTLTAVLKRFLRERTSLDDTSIPRCVLTPRFDRSACTKQSALGLYSRHWQLNHDATW
jgi:hypothetical protein